MANFFDQYVKPPVGPSPAAPDTQPNFFQQYVTPPGNDPANPMVAAPETATPEPGNVWTDIPASLGTGVVRGAAETLMLPATINRLGQQGAGYVLDRGEDLVRHIFGMDPVTDEERAKQQEFAQQINPIDNAVNSAQDTVRAAMDDHLYAPQTTPGKFAETVGEFLVPGGVPSKSARLAPTIARKVEEYGADLARHAVVPGVASEAAGQLTEGTPFEAPARVAGAVLGNVGSGVVKAANAPESVLRRAVGPEDSIDWARAVGLQNNGTGVRLTGPEAIAQAQNGASALPDVMRVVEGSIDGNQRLAPFFAERPAQVEGAVNTVLDQIAPQSTQPSSLGPRASIAADGALDTVRQDINASTKPLYQAAETQLIPAADFAATQADPRFQAGLARLRGNPELAPDFANLPDNSIAVVDAVTKDMFARGEAMGNSANSLYGPYLGGLTTEGATTARNAGTNASPDYAQALAEQAARRQSELAPLENGPLGQLAGAKDTTAAGNTILPKNPLVGSEGEIADAVTRLIMQDAPTTKGLVRQNLADRFSAASTDTQQGANQFAGAKFAKDVSGNAQRDATLYAVLDALGAKDASAAMPELLDVLQATGRRKPIGSATEFNRSINSDLGTGSPVARGFDLVKSLGASWLTNAGDGLKRAALRNSTATLADMFTDPNSVELIRAALSRGHGVNFAEALARAAAQSGVTVNPRAEALN